MKMVEVAMVVSAADWRSFPWIRRSGFIPARALGIYSRGADYTDSEAAAIHREVLKIFPHRGE